MPLANCLCLWASIGILVGEPPSVSSILGIERRLQGIRYQHNNIVSEVQRTSGFETIASGSYIIMSLALIE